MVIRGIEELDAKLRDLDRSVQAKALMSSLKEHAEITRARAADLAPVGDPSEGDPHAGRLKAHEDIATVPSLSSSKVAVVRVGPRLDAFYGLFQEIGTAHHVAQPFLEPAFEETKDEVLSKIADTFKQALGL